jgi:glycosyltransferase involved in cell wall biosynthesis
MVRKKILLWTSSYSPVLGGLQNVVLQLVNYYNDRGYDVLVLTNRYPFNLPLFQNVQPSAKIIRIIHWNPNTKGFKKNIHYLGFILNSMIMSLIVRTFKPDKVLIHFPDCQIPYLQRVYLNSKTSAWSITFHGHDILRYFDCGIDYSYSNIRNIDSIPSELLIFIKKYNIVLNACSKWLAERVRMLFLKDCSYIHNAIDLNFKIIDEHVLNYKEPFFFAFGRLEEHKGFHLLVEAFVMAKKFNKNLPNLIIAGEGSFKPKLDELIPTEFRNNILFLGRLNFMDLFHWGSNADSIWVPSLREPFGIVILESLMMNNNVFASSVGGISEAGSSFVSYFTPSVEDKYKHLEEFSIPLMAEKYLNL